MKVLETYALPIVAIICLLLFASHLGVIDASIMEARNFIVSREMLSENHWLLTTMNNVPRYQKPPLPSWLATPFAALFGMNTILSYRLPTALMATFSVIGCFNLVQYIGRQKSIAVIAALVMASSFYVIGIQKEAPTDIYTHGFMLWGIYFLFKFFSVSAYRWSWVLLAGVFTSASMLSKGPVSLYALFLPFIIAYAITFGFKQFSRKWLPFVVFIIITVMLGGWWFVYVKLADPVTFTKIAEEETGNWSSYNVRPFYYYWSFFTQSGLWTIPAFFSLFYPLTKKYSTFPKLYKFSWVWTLAVIVLLSIIPEKKARYLMPVLIPLAINIAMFLEVVFKVTKQKLPKWIMIPMYVHFYIIALVACLLPLASVYFIVEAIGVNWFWFVLLAISTLTVGVLLFKSVKQKTLIKATLLCVLFEVSIVVFGLPLAESFNKNSAYHRLDENYQEPTYIFGAVQPEILWQIHSVAPQLSVKEEVKIPAEKQFYVVVSPDKIDEFKRIFVPLYHLTPQSTIDLNIGASPGERKHRDRLVSYHFKLEKL